MAGDFCKKRHEDGRYCVLAEDHYPPECDFGRETKVAEEKVIVSPNLAAKPSTCPEQAKKTQLIAEEFSHTRKRLAREKVFPLLQFTVFAYNCDRKNHPELGAAETAVHTDYSSMGSDVIVPNGLEATIAAVEHLLSALKAKQS